MTENTRSILFISGWFPNRVTPTNGDFVQRHAKAVSTKCRVKVLHVQYDKTLKKRIEKSSQAETKSYEEIIIYFNVRLKLLKPFMYFKYYMSGFKQLYKESSLPDIVHSNIIYPSGLIAFFYKLKFGISYIISEHWSIYLPLSEKSVPAWRKPLERFVIKRSGAVCPVTKNLADALMSHGYKGNFLPVPNVVDTDKFNVRSDSISEKHCFIHVSTLQDKSKNIRGMLRTFKQLSEIRQDFMLNIIGGDELEAHVDYAQSLGILDKFVFFHGEKDHNDIPELLNQNNSFVLFSNYESLPCVIIEALASGLPVIATKVGGIGEYIDESNGILVPAGDEDALLSSLQKMIDNYQHFDADKLRDFAIDKFSIQAVAQKFMNVYTTIIEKC